MGHICENCFREFGGKTVNNIYGSYIGECDLCDREEYVIRTEDIRNITEVIDNFKCKQREDIIKDLLS